MANSDSEGAEMRTSHEVRLNLYNINVPTIVAILGVALTAYGVYAKGRDDDAKALAEFVKSQEVVNARLANLEEGQEQAETSYATRRAATDARFQKIEANMEPLGSLIFRVQQLEASSNKVADAIEQQTGVLNDARIAIGILTQKVDALADRRAGLKLDGPPAFLSEAQPENRSRR